MTTTALVVGSLVMDLTFRVPRRPEAGQLVVATEHAAFRGGKGYNQAIALARLGSQVAMVGAVGSDAYGAGFLEALASEGVDAGRVVRMRGAPTGLAVPLITPDGSVSFVQYPGANRYLAPAHCAELPDCDVLMLQGEVSPATSQSAARVIAGRGGIVLLRPAPSDNIDAVLLETATVLVGNESELVTMLSRPAAGEGLAAALAGDDRGVVVTLGSAGAAWASPWGKTGFVAAPQVTAVDSTASGASFDAALAVSLAEGAGYRDAVRVACAAGAQAATVRGAEPSLPTREQVEALLAAAPAE